jgi:hypothetical protein
MITVLGTSFCAMSGEVTDKAMTSDKEQIHVVVRQTRKGIEHKTVNRHKDGSREAGLFIELYPVGIVIVGHGTLNYISSSPSTLLYDWLSHRHVTMETSGRWSKQ